MDKVQFRIAALGALGGAVLSVAVVFVSAALGALPVNGEAVKRYLMAHPTIMLDMMTKVQLQQAADADRVQNELVAAIGEKALLDPKVSYVTGPADAKNTLVEFFDYNCVHCRNSLAAMKKYYAEHKGDTRFAFIDFPIFGQMSDVAARGALPVNGEAVKCYLMSHPTIMLDMMTMVQLQQAADADRVQNELVAAIGEKALLDPKVSYVTGPADAKNTLVEFFDYNCVHCRNSLAAMKKYYAEHKSDTRFAFIDFPIFGQMSDVAARAAIAARKQGDKYVTFSFLMMGEKGAITSVDMVYNDAKAAGLDISKLIEDMKDPETA